MITSNGSIVWCTYDKRIDHHRACSGKHTHKFTTVKQKRIENYTRSTHITKCNDIYTQIAHFATISKLPLEMEIHQISF